MAPTDDDVAMFQKHNQDGYQPALQGIDRKTLVHGENTLMTEFRLHKGSVLPRHSHPHEQTGYLVEALVRRCRPRDLWTGAMVPGVEAETLKRVKLLVNAGARWDPTPDEVRSNRRAILEHDARYIAELLRLLLSVPTAVNIDTFRELCRTHTIRAKAAAADFDLDGALAATSSAAALKSPNPTISAADRV